MNPVSESRFLPSFFAVAASLVMVCGGIVLLTSTAPWTPRATTEPSMAGSEFYVAEAEAPTKIEVPRSTSEPDEAPTAAADPEANSGEETQVAEAQPASPEPVQPLAASPSPALDEAATAAPGMPQAPEADGAAAAEAVPAESMVVSETATPESAPDADGTVAAEAVAAESMVVSETAPPESAPETDGVVAAEAVAAESMVMSETETPESAPETGAAPKAAAVDSGEPAMPVAAETTEAATDQIGELLAVSPPGAIATETIVEDSDDATDLPAPAPAARPATTSGASEAESPAITAAVTLLPPPPLPKRKPKAEPAASSEIARSAPRPERPSRPEAPKKGQAGSAVAQQGPTRSAPRPQRSEAPKQGHAGPAVAQQPRSGAGWWLPMALAPADKPVAAQVPTARPSGAAYAGKVWAALARNKPRAGQNGSASVVFSIGPGGGLGGVRIGRSSGNTKIDQLALATVRSAAPFPPPPSGAASFSIRIDFH